MNKILNFLKKTQNKILKLNKWSKLALLFAVVLVILIIVNKSIPKIEGFSQQKKFVLKKGNEIYDSFYCSVYDDLVYDEVKNNFEMKELKRLLKFDDDSKLLDVGCGTGHHVNSFAKLGVDAQGVDNSESMISVAQKKFPELTFKKGDVRESMLYPQSSLTHITSFYFTIYYIKEKNQFLQNCYNWLQPGGYLILHLVNRDKFDPILNTADPLYLVSAQKHAKKRITNSIVKFKDFTYKANFDYKKEKDISEFSETFKDDATSNVRQNVHTLYMETQKKILQIAKSKGFILHGKIDMVGCMYEYQYLYILQKPK